MALRGNWAALLLPINADACLDNERRLRTFIDAHIAPFGREQRYSNAALDKLLAAIGGWRPSARGYGVPIASSTKAKRRACAPSRKPRFPSCSR
jgi:hypothetical protein